MFQNATQQPHFNEGDELLPGPGLKDKKKATHPCNFRVSRYVCARAIEDTPLCCVAQASASGRNDNTNMQIETHGESPFFCPSGALFGQTSQHALGEILS